jgi:Family of unknown function (DUF6931)
MSSIRFATVRDLYEVFPTAEDDVKIPPSDESSLTFLKTLVSQQSWNQAISFCAYLLPRREAIWWGCQSVRRFQPQCTAKEAAALDLAEAWTHNPDDQLRRQALELGNNGDGMFPATWMLLAVGWSGGSLIPTQFGMVPAAPQQTARAVRGGVMLSLAMVPKEQTAQMAKPCLENAIALAVDEQHS